MLACAFLFPYLCLLAGCGRSQEASAGDAPQTNRTAVRPAGQEPNQLSQDERGRALDAALAHAAKVREERLTNPPVNEISLPNFDSGPGLPRPLGFNFYRIDKRFPAYLLCTYDVSENHYDPSNEAEWFKAALLQIRATGAQSFPPIKWIAVAIVNVAEHKGESTFEQSFKAGAVFRASDVFDLEHDLRKTISQADVDRHPFKYGTPQSTSGEQQRWTVVEQHAATNHTATGSQQR